MPTNIQIDADDYQDATDRRSFYAGFATRVTQVARELASQGRGFGDRKVYLSDLCQALGTRLELVARPLALCNYLGLLSLARNDLVVDVQRSQASEVSDGLSSWHFVTLG